MTKIASTFAHNLIVFIILSLCITLSLIITPNVYADETHISTNISLEQYEKEHPVVQEEDIQENETPLTSFDHINEDSSVTFGIFIITAIVIAGGMFISKQRKNDRYSDSI